MHNFAWLPDGKRYAYTRLGIPMPAPGEDILEAGKPLDLGGGPGGPGEPPEPEEPEEEEAVETEEDEDAEE